MNNLLMIYLLSKNILLFSLNNILRIVFVVAKLVLLYKIYAALREKKGA